MRRRPAPRSTGAVLVCVVVLLTAACSGTVSLDAPTVSGADASACRALVDALPAEVADQGRVESDDGSGYGAAWGDPAIELRCGVAKPAGIDEFAPCTEVDGVGWFIPESQGNNEPVTMTTLNRSAYVQVQIPAD